MKHRHKPDVGICWVWGSTQTVDALTNTMRSTYLLTGSVFGSIQFGGDGSLPALSPPQPSPVAAELLPRVQAADGSITIDIVLSIQASTSPATRGPETTSRSAAHSPIISAAPFRWCLRP
ncbi:hypothetical protein OCJ37_09915 [Xanthomonas sp. AM6]|uniref:hypothetical protein n=1 Tax=Xanthomonas sp. AM6 TaxID=2982531 RepID=UPI0021D95315|nr:hypothetical protein [Xanthomonas sp. AM6]UYB54213.1 hypothetical protein OCJ37_09915 [Xanthomonas sp. AM6]